MIKSPNSNGPVVLVAQEIQYTFPFSYAYLAGYLIEQKENVVILFRPDNPSEFKLFVQKIIDLKPLMVGFGNLYPEIYDIGDIIELLRKKDPDIPLVIGGQMVSPTPEFAVEVTKADIGIIGEGEIILHELVRALRKNRDPKSVKGLMVHDDDKFVNTGPGKFIENLDDLPKVPYDLFPSEKWIAVGKYFTRIPQPLWHYNDRVIPIHGGRGCPYKCNFCYHHSRPRYRKLEHMIQEAGELVNRYDGNLLQLNDDLVLSTPKRAQKLVELIDKLDRPVEYRLSCRFNILDKIDDDLLKELKRTGCRIMNIGVESGSQKILDIMRKQVTVEQIKTGLERLYKVGIFPTTCIMVGQPTETIEDAEMSLKLMVDAVRQNPDIEFAFSIATPFPGSEIYDYALDKGLLKDHYDFYERFKPVRHMGGMTVNLSEMSDEQLIGMYNKLSDTYREEKAKVAGKVTAFVEKQIKNLDSFNNRVTNHRFYSDKNPLSSVYNKAYDISQIALDKSRFRLRSLGM